MQLQKLTLIDFGVYKGQVTFDLSPKETPIIIFGGKNGSGKTTLLEAIKLCLYGPRALGRKIGRKDYDEYIRNRVHRIRSAIVPLDFTSVSLDFDYSLFGIEHRYEITRSWKIHPDSTQERLQINVDKKILTGVPEDRWQEYIDDLVPPSIADLFFFDGEKIQSLIVDNFNEQALAVEVKRLLGLNIVEKLQADLETYLNRQRKENAVPELQAKLTEAETIYQAADQKFQIKHIETAKVQSEISNTNGQIEKLEGKISRESSGYAFQRETLKLRLAKIDTELEGFEKQLQELSAGLLPFTLVPELCQELKKQLINEAKVHQWQASNELLAPKVKQIQSTLQAVGFWNQLGINDSFPNLPVVIQQISYLMNSLLESEENYKDIKIIHQVAAQERYKIISWIDESSNEIPEKVKELGAQLSYLLDSHKDLQIKLHSVPDDDVLRPLMEELNRLNQQVGELKGKLNQLDQEKSALENERNESTRQLKKAFENIKIGNKIESRLLLVEKTQNALNAFLLEATKRKIHELENLVVSRFNQLIRKPDLVQQLVIDPQSFHIQLYDLTGAEIPKDQLSAGEKQMFAIALLWALRDLSGKPFPVIIDTPLGRLDSDHREHLVNQYFPNVSHQVILFSTDTEIDKTYFEALDPHVSHSYHLEYDSSTGTSSASLGYFWDKENDGTQQN